MPIGFKDVEQRILFTDRSTPSMAITQPRTKYVGVNGDVNLWEVQRLRYGHTMLLLVVVVLQGFDYLGNGSW
jgi:hypothetical protein